MAKELPRVDLIKHYRLETFFREGSVSHTIRSPFTYEEEWRCAEVIGRGGFSVVHLEHGPNNRVRAVKVIDKAAFLPALDFTRELTIMSFLTEVFLGWFEDSENLYISMEYFEKGDLRRYLSERVSVPTAKLLARQLLEGLNVMHRNGIAHRDIKPENIFVVSLSPFRVKLGDFGVSKFINEHTTLRTRVFTRSYSAPEILGALESSLEASEYTRAVDIWSLGCVMFEVLTGSVLFKMECFVWHFCYGKAEIMLGPLREAMSDEGGFEFVGGLLPPEPMGRPSAVEALRDPWLKVPEIRRVEEGGGGRGYAKMAQDLATCRLWVRVFYFLMAALRAVGKSGVGKYVGGRSGGSAARIVRFDFGNYGMLYRCRNSWGAVIYGYVLRSLGPATD
ncbi:kinase-like domain-containing protein [Tuber borchii]|uniref:non-specific serine/threonine protein kinase n=1 Tax=Tuber borchii TaxID=42251 RepID=A0A2T7A7N7_TUBBO|nr:kinase-like domain-containing protein [Tuber borchii]